jgi:hypothetical protein
MLTRVKSCKIVISLIIVMRIENNDFLQLFVRIVRNSGNSSKIGVNPNYEII